MGLQPKVQRAVKENLHPGGLMWGSAGSSCVAPIIFGHLLRPGFEISPCARAGPKAAAAGDEEVGLPGELVRPQYAVVPS
jgi:hypothetical protein